MVAQAIKSDGGFVWACKNYDGDVMVCPELPDHPSPNDELIFRVIFLLKDSVL